MRKIIFAVIVFILLLGIGVAAWQVYLPIQEDNESVQAYADLRQYVRRPELTLIEDVPQQNQPDSSSAAENAPFPDTTSQPDVPAVDFVALQEINPEIVAWLTIPGTNIDYPIAQHRDNDYYLHHLFTGEWNSSGCLFMDCRNEPDFTDRHTIIYGHHMDNGTMFQNLMGYKNQQFFDQHPTGQLITPDGSYTVEFIAGYVASVEDDAWSTSFISDEEFTQWLEETQERSMFNSAIKPTGSDHILSLSTCSYEFYDARCVILGKIAHN